MTLLSYEPNLPSHPLQCLWPYPPGPLACKESQIRAALCKVLAVVFQASAQPGVVPAINVSNSSDS